MMLFKNTKVKVRSPDRYTENFDIVVGVLQRDTLAPYMLFICIDYTLRMSIDLMKENGFKLAMDRNRRYHTQTIANADYTDNIALLANSHTSPQYGGPLKLVDKVTYLGSGVS